VTLEDDEGHRYWMGELGKGADRKNIENYFRQVAMKENSESKSIKMSEVLSEDDEGERVLLISPRNPRGAFIATSLLKSIKELNKNHNLYVACEKTNACFFEGNEYVHKIIPFTNEMQNPQWVKGLVEQENYFDTIYSSNNFDLENFSVFSKSKKKSPYSDLKYAHD